MAMSRPTLSKGQDFTVHPPAIGMMTVTEHWDFRTPFTLGSTREPDIDDTPGSILFRDTLIEHDQALTTILEPLHPACVLLLLAWSWATGTILDSENKRLYILGNYHVREYLILAFEGCTCVQYHARSMNASSGSTTGTLLAVAGV